MEGFFINYRDPVFSVILLVAIITIVAFASYWWGIFINIEEKEKIEKFIEKFDLNNENKEDFKEILQKFRLPNDSLLLLARAFTKSGDYEKAIAFYLISLESIKDKKQKRIILTELGKMYFRAGFLHKAEEIFTQSLRFNPRNEVALTFLTVIYEKLKKYDEALKVLEALEEMQVNIYFQKDYIMALSIREDKKLNQDEKIQKLLNFKDTLLLVQRMIFELWDTRKGKEELINSFDTKQILDLLWYEENLDFSKLTNPLSEVIKKAKGLENNCQHSEYFELEILGKLREIGFKKANLSFEYLCKNCRQIFPMYFYRCPNCHRIDKCKIIPNLIEDKNEESLPF